MSPKPESPSPETSRYDWRWKTVVALLVFLAAAQVLSICTLFPSPVELTYPNSVMVYVAREVQHGRPIYRDFRQPPHIVALYGPLSYALPGLVGRLCDADEVGLFRIGRGLSLLFTGGSFVVIGWLLRRREHVRWGVVLVALLVLGTARVTWPVSMCPRPDAAELFFVLLGLAVFLVGENTPWRYASLVCFVTAFLFKQSAFIAPVAIVVYLLARRRVRSAALFAAAAGLVYAAAILTVNHLTGGLYILNNFTALRANHTYSNLPTIVGVQVLIPCAVPIIPAAIGVWRRWRAREVDLYSVYFVLAFIVACAGVVRDGASDNYFLKVVALACLVGGPELQRLLALKPASSPPKPARALHTVMAIGIAFFAVHAVAAISFVYTTLTAWPVSAERNAHGLQVLKRAAAELDRLDGPIISQYDPLSLYCRKPLLMDTLTLSGLADQGVFDDAGVVAAIRQRKVAAVVLQFPLEPGVVPPYQSTDYVRRTWLQAMIDAGYRTADEHPLYFYFPPPDEP